METAPSLISLGMQRPHITTLVFATHNANKAREVQQLLGPTFEIKTLTDIGCHEEITEDADTLPGNARIKARHVVEHYGLDCFADDTGLLVDALAGAPGVHTARYAGPNATADDNMDKLLSALEGVADRSARFVTVFCVIREGHEVYIEGVCEGTIATEKSGGQGFGYDPVFIPKGHNTTFSEMTSLEKNAISHRGKAVRSMVDALLERS